MSAERQFIAAPQILFMRLCDRNRS